MKVMAMFSKARASKLVRRTLIAPPLALAPALSGVVMQAIGLEGFQSGVAFAQGTSALERRIED